MCLRMLLGAVVALFSLAFGAPQTLAQSGSAATQSDVSSTYSPIRDFADYTFDEYRIPMRDGVELHTIVVMKKGVDNAPILLSRTPYNASGWARRNISQSIVETLPIAEKELVEDGYIRVYQDIRGREKSGGNYIFLRPLRGPLNDTAVDHSTDAYDTIDWLVKNIPESNGRVAINGSSYPGHLALMAAVDPHPALKAVVSMSPMVDGWIGDDFFHNGAFRQATFDFFAFMSEGSSLGSVVPLGNRDQYREFLDTGSAGDFAKKWALDELPLAQTMMANAEYTEWWQHQAVDKLLAERDLKVPVMIVMAQWDAEDAYGAKTVYRTLEAKDPQNERVHYVLGPWRHSQALHDGRSLGPLKFAGDTARQFRVRVQKPFLDNHLRPERVTSHVPQVITYATGVNEWRERVQWPDARFAPIYLAADGGLAFKRPDAEATASYISDPNNPVPFAPRPNGFFGHKNWFTWKLDDQRFVDSRPDVITFVTEPLSEPLEIAGSPRVDLYAATSGTDSDWVVKLIDVYPEEGTLGEAMPGYQLAVSLEIFRGRYIDSFTKPRPLRPNVPERYQFDLMDVNHVFRKGHRIMVQIQSSQFPLYDRNPQTFVENIFFAQPKDYRVATQTIHLGGARASAVMLPIHSRGDDN